MGFEATSGVEELIMVGAEIFGLCAVGGFVNFWPPSGRGSRDRDRKPTRAFHFRIIPSSCDSTA
jgi:hypothetical protein